METKIRGLQNPKPGSKAAPPQQCGLYPLFLSTRLYGPVLAVYEGKGGTATGGESTRTRLHKGVFLRPLGHGRAFKGLSVAKQYCRRDSMGDRFVQRLTFRRARGTENADTPHSLIDIERFDFLPFVHYGQGEAFRAFFEICFCALASEKNQVVTPAIIRTP